MHVTCRVVVRHSKSILCETSTFAANVGVSASIDLKPNMLFNEDALCKRRFSLGITSSQVRVMHCVRSAGRFSFATVYVNPFLESREVSQVLLEATIMIAIWPFPRPSLALTMIV